MITEPDRAKLRYVARRRHEVFEMETQDLDEVHEILLQKAVRSPYWVFVIDATSKGVNWWLHKLFPYFPDGISTVDLSENRKGFITWQVT